MQVEYRTQSTYIICNSSKAQPVQQTDGTILCRRNWTRGKQFLFEGIWIINQLFKVCFPFYLNSDNHKPSLPNRFIYKNLICLYWPKFSLHHANSINFILFNDNYNDIHPYSYMQISLGTHITDTQKSHGSGILRFLISLSTYFLRVSV